MRSYLRRVWSDSRLMGGAALSAVLGLMALLPLAPGVRALPGMALFVLGFALFDAVGWGTGVHWPRRWHDRVSVLPYRVIQHLFLASLALNVGLLFGWRAAAAGVVAWWFGACDLLFYLLLRLPPPARNADGQPFHYGWMERWSVHAPVWLLLRIAGVSYACRRTHFVVGALLGLLAGAAICLWPL
jgi:hypothetical protein